MANIAVVGAQWGDEGKGKVVDFLAGKFDYVVRFQGGPNAGHSVVFGGERYALHVLPSGVFQPEVVNVIGNGVVVDPFSLVKEIEGLKQRGIGLTPRNLKISNRAHIIMPYHGILDRYRDALPGQRKIGTTGRGIGPTYEWKAARRGIRFCDTLHPEYLHQQIEQHLAALHHRYPDIEEIQECRLPALMEKLKPVLGYLEPHVTDSVQELAEARAQGKSILYEGAQATLLDIDFGTYPYLTSSNSCAVGVTAGAGVPPMAVDGVVGIFKAYATRVGEGPFPTEIHGATADMLRDAGKEFGTTTGRPRRCGWLDLVALKYAQSLNGFDTLAIMKLDVLDSFEEVKVCTGYRIGDRTSEAFPACIEDFRLLEPTYKSLPGWKTPLTAITRYDALPEAARNFLAFIEQQTRCGIGLISLGPDRVQTIKRDARFFA